MDRVSERRAGKCRGKSVAQALRTTPLLGPRWRSALGLLSVISLSAVPGVTRADDMVARGAYLAKVTGCEGCHSAHDAAGAVAPSRLMAGGDHPIRAARGTFIVPPNLTSDRDSGIGGWTAASIVTAIRTGRTPDGRTLSIAMPWRTQYAYLTDVDAEAIAAYLLTVPPVHSGGAAAETVR
jgi:mono/diheme cytochrome c family protein